MCGWRPGRGVLVPSLGLWIFRPLSMGFASQQTTELHAIAWVVRLVNMAGRSSLTVLSDSKVAIAQVLHLCTQGRFSQRHYLLRSLARVRNPPSVRPQPSQHQAPAAKGYTTLWGRTCQFRKHRKLQG